MIHAGDCRAVMAEMAAAGERVQCVITSPPYWGLRAYGNAACVWGGSPDCAHEWATTVQTRDMRTGNGLAALGERYGGGGHKQGTIGEQVFERSTCTKCSAWHGELGHERLHDCAGWATGNDCGACYLCHLREVMRGVWSALADDGICWVNLGDSYASGLGSGAQGKTGQRAGRRHTQRSLGVKATRGLRGGVALKSLMLMPQRFALAMQADGWIVRRDVIWQKPNAMPESCRDRPATAHEYIWMLTKQRRYYYDAEAVRVEAVGERAHDLTGCGYDAHGQTKQNGNRRVRAPAGWDTGKGGHGSYHKEGRAQEVEYREVKPGRNLRSVWTIATAPYPGAHYATFPMALVRPMILASSRAGDTVFDPFAGTGTVAMEAQRLGRKFSGAEINPDNRPLQAERLRGPVGLAL